MATVHREPNQVKWIGVRPGHNGEQILEHNQASNNTVIIYTVPADKLLLIFDYFISLYGAVNVQGTLALYTDVPALWKYLYDGAVRANNDISIAHNYGIIPVELPAGYSIRITSTAVAAVTAGIHGILIDV